MDGLGRRFPFTFGAFLLGSLSVIGLPPMGGSWSKWYLMWGAVEADQLAMMAVYMLSSLLAIGYGVVSVKWILGQPDGNERMREIAQAIQEGASAYLNRQYTTIGIVGAILTVVVLLLQSLKGPKDDGGRG